MAGWYHQALDLDGVDDQVVVPDAADLRLTSYLSYSFWVRGGALTVGAGMGGKWDHLTGNKSWKCAVGQYLTHTRAFFLQLSSDGATNDKVWVSTLDVFPASGWMHMVMTVANGTPGAYFGDTPITGWHKATDNAIGAIYAGTADLHHGFYNGIWPEAGICNISLWGGTGILTQADVTALNAFIDPNGLVPSGGAVLIGSWLYDPALPLVPGANDVPDNTGSNPGSTSGTMTQGDVVDSPWHGPWASVSRPYLYNRATKTADGTRTAWLSPSPVTDAPMAYHPEPLDPTDYGDFVVTGIDRA